MKFNLSKILERLNNVTNLALDDFEDTEIPSQYSKQIKDIDALSIHKELMVNDIIDKINSYQDNCFYYIIWSVYSEGRELDQYDFSKLLDAKVCKDFEIQILLDILKGKNIFNREFVDLDLPSKTLWCTKNLGGNDYIDLGDTYKWGSIIKTEDDHDIDQKNILNKQLCADLSVSSKVELDMEPYDDAASHINGNYRIPSVNNFIELKNYTNIINVFNGILLVSKKDPLNFIFFNQSNTLCMTRTIANYNKFIPNNQPSITNINIFFMKIFGTSDIFIPIPFKSFSVKGKPSFKIPPASGYIRPIYVK